MMPKTYIKNGDVITPDALLKNTTVSIDGGKIASVGGKVTRHKGAEVIDAQGLFVSPGFIDTHIHGAPDEIFKNEIRHGTTSVVIAESCASSDEIFGKIRAIEEFVVKSPFGRNILGVRLEGPYISKDKAGAQDRRYIKDPDLREARSFIKECGPLLRMMTIAPEVKGAIQIIRFLRRRGIIVSVGHSAAKYDEAMRGIDSGITHATHIFNAMRPPDGKDPGVSTAVLLSDKVKAEVILDLTHVRKALFNVLVAVKGIENTILVTDSVRAEYESYPQRSAPLRVRYRDGVYKFDNGIIAGSALTTIGALKNCVKECGVPITDAVKMLTVNPAKLLGLDRIKGRIAAGMDADIVIFDKDFDVKMTIINGEIVYSQRNTQYAMRNTKQS